MTSTLYVLMTLIQGIAHFSNPTSLHNCEEGRSVALYGKTIEEKYKANLEAEAAMHAWYNDHPPRMPKTADEWALVAEAKCEHDLQANKTRSVALIICDCCERLIPSSNSKRITVADASTMTPSITNKVGSDQRFPRFVSSQTIPAPTASPPTTAAKISQKWGSDGSTPPEKNWEAYAEMAEAFILPLFGIAFIVIAIVRSLVWATKRHLSGG